MLTTFLASFTELDEAERAALAEVLTVRHYPKGAILLQEDMVARECFFVLSGCIRQYLIVDGEEKTTGFFTEKQAIITVPSYISQTPSRHYLSCVEATTLIVGTLAEEQAMYQQFPKLIAITRAMMAQDYGRSQEQLTTFMVASPEERYLDLLQNRPDLLRRVPQYQLASYLGVTPESLSRIRKRLLSRKS